MKKTYFILIMALFVSSCASGVYILTGHKRKPIDANLVKMYSAPPHKYKAIAVLYAYSMFTLTQQMTIDASVANLKEQAANLGANGIMSVKISKEQPRDGSEQNISAIAVYVIKE